MRARAHLFVFFSGLSLVGCFAEPRFSIAPDALAHDEVTTAEIHLGGLPPTMFSERSGGELRLIDDLKIYSKPIFAACC